MDPGVPLVLKWTTWYVPLLNLATFAKLILTASYCDYLKCLVLHNAADKKNLFSVYILIS